MLCGLMWPMGISSIFQRPLTVPLHSPNGRQMPAIRVVQEDCKIVYHTTVLLPTTPIFAHHTASSIAMNTTILRPYWSWNTNHILIHGDRTWTQLDILLGVLHHISHTVQYHGCWWPGDARSQGINNHDIDLFSGGLWTDVQTTTYLLIMLQTGHNLISSSEFLIRFHIILSGGPFNWWSRCTNRILIHSAKKVFITLYLDENFIPYFIRVAMGLVEKIPWHFPDCQ